MSRSLKDRDLFGIHIREIVFLDYHGEDSVLFILSRIKNTDFL